MKFCRKTDEAFTGLEAAIVLIAFVVVAAVFSYVVLGAGFFTTQKSQEVVHTGVQQASSTVEIVGNIYGTTNDLVPYRIDYVNFSAGLAAGGTAVDFDKVVLTYSNATQLLTLSTLIATTGTVKGEPGANQWAVTSVQNQVGSANDLLEPGEQFTISAKIAPGIYQNDRFSIELKPSVGAALDVQRTAPAAIHNVNILY